jgi:hypothetical protein
VAQAVPGAHLNQTQIVAFMTAAAVSALTAGWKWLQGWQQHEALVAEGKDIPVKPGPAAAATVAVPVVAPAPALPAFPGDRKRSISGVSRSWLPGLGIAESAPCPDSCRILRAGRRVKGARSARVAAPQAPLTRLCRERIMPGGGQGALAGGYGSAVRAGGLSARDDQLWRVGAGP